MDCYRHLAEDRLAETLANEVIHASTDFDGTERAPMRLAEARITLGVVAARQGDLEQAVELWRARIERSAKSLPSLLMVSRDLTRVLNDKYRERIRRRWPTLTIFKRLPPQILALRYLNPRR